MGIRDIIICRPKMKSGNDNLAKTGSFYLSFDDHNSGRDANLGTGTF